MEEGQREGSMRRIQHRLLALRGSRLQGWASTPEELRAAPAESQEEKGSSVLQPTAWNLHKQGNRACPGPPDGTQPSPRLDFSLVTPCPTLTYRTGRYKFVLCKPPDFW